MNRDFTKYRLTNLSEIEPYKEKMGKRKFYDYGISIYEALNKIPRDKPFDVYVNVKRVNLPLFIKIVCMFMIDYPGFVDFNQSYTKIYNVRIRKR